MKSFKKMYCALVTIISLTFSSISFAAVGPANQIYFAPNPASFNLADGIGSLDLMMDFNDSTIGGGIDLAFSGSISFNAFTPSAFVTGLDSSFTGSGTADADQDFEIHWGDFAGFTGSQHIGTLAVNLDSLGTGLVALQFNSTYGDFIENGGSFGSLPVSLVNAEVNVSAVPLPSAVWFMVSGLALLFNVKRPTISLPH